jgi:hypothetical protein
VRQWADELATAVRSYGAGGFVFFGDDVSAERWSREVVPQVRAILDDQS